MSLGRPVYDLTMSNPLGAPEVTFLPSKALMEQMMRVCTECKDIFEVNYVLCTDLAAAKAM